MSVPTFQGNLHGGLDTAIDQEVRRVGVWRGTGRNILHQRNAPVGLTILVFLGLCALFADQLSSYPPDQVLLGVVDGVKKSSPPCIHVLGCPADQPQFLMGTDRQLPRRLQPGRLRRADVALRRLRDRRIRDRHRRDRSALLAGYAGGWTDNLLCA